MGPLSRFPLRLADLLGDLTASSTFRQTLQQVEEHLREGHPAAALTLLQAADQERPGHPASLALRGQAHEALQEWDAADLAWARVDQARPSLAARAARARIAEARGAWADALRYGDDALRLADDDAERCTLLQHMARAARGAGEPAAALAPLRSAFRIRPHDRTLGLELADALVLSGDPVRAIHVLRGLHQRAPDDPDPLATRVRDRLAECLLATPEDTAQAAEALDCLELSNRRHGVTLERARLCARARLRLGDTAGALPRLIEALSLATPDALADIHRDISEVHLRVGQPVLALDALRAAAVLQPDGGAFHAAHAGAALRCGHWREALDAAARARAAGHDDPDLGRASAWALLQTGDFEEARAGLALLRHESPDSLQLVGQALLALHDGDPVEALALAREAAHLDRTSPWLESLWPRLREALQPHLPIPDAPPTPEQALALVQACRELVTGHPHLRTRVRDLDPLLRRLDRPLAIAVLGEFNAGKSTVINAWLRADVVATGVLPTTAHRTILRWGPRPLARWIAPDGSVEELSPADAARRVRQDPDSASALELLYPHADLQAVHLWDTPGFNAPVEGHEDRALEALEEADAILWILDAGQALSQSEFDHLRRIEAPANRLLVVVNKIDRLEDDAQREAVLAHLRPYLEGRCLGIFPLCALQARRAWDEAPDARDRALHDAGWPPFVEALQQRLIHQAPAILAAEVLRALADWAREVAGDAAAQLHQVQQQRQDGEAHLRWLEERWPQRIRTTAADAGTQADCALEALRGQVAGDARRLSLPPRGLFSTRRVLDGEDLQLLEHRTLQGVRQALEHGLVPVEALQDQLDQRISGWLMAAAQALEGADARQLRARLQDGSRARRGALRATRESAEPWITDLRSRWRWLAAERLQALLDESQDASAEAGRALQDLLPLPGDAWRPRLERALLDQGEEATQLVRAAMQDLDILALDLEHRIVRPLQALADPGTQPPPGPLPADHGPLDVAETV
jgi:GTP-binding protein EngB required for normal cell division/predicted Zn-dependent protease